MKSLKYIVFIVALYMIPAKSGSMLLGNHQEPFHLNMALQKDTLRSPQINDYFENLVRAGFSGAMLVARQGEIIYKNAHGLKSSISRDSLTTHSSFQLASVSKQFTAAAIMKLKEWGVLEYSDKVKKHIPEFPYPEVTIRQLLVHRSGLSEYTYFMDKHVTDRRNFIGNDDVLNYMMKHKPAPYYRAGRAFNYRNTNYMLLASVVERITEMSFPEFMKGQFFQPLNMQHAFVFTGNKDFNRPYITRGHHYKWRLYHKHYLDGVYGDKGIYASVEDLFKWDRALYTNKLLKQSTLRKAFKPGSPDRHYKNYGFGWRMRKDNSGQTFYYHPGWWHGYKTLYVRIPKTQSSIFILSNEVYNHFMSTYPKLIKLLKKRPELPA